MLHVEFTDTMGNKWERINKREARNLYYKGYTIGLLPGNCNPYYIGACFAHINLFDTVQEFPGYWSDFYCFNHMVNEFEIYNCCASEWFKYASFYKRINEVPAEKPTNEPPVFWEEIRACDEWGCYK